MVLASVPLLLAIVGPAMVEGKAANTGADELIVSDGAGLKLLATGVSAAASAGAVSVKFNIDLLGNAITAVFVTGATNCAAACTTPTALLAGELLLVGGVALPPLLFALLFTPPFTLALFELPEIVACSMLKVPLTKLMKS